VPRKKANTANPISPSLKSGEFKYTQSVTQLKIPAKEQKINTKQKIFNNESSNNSNDKDYDYLNNVVASQTWDPPRSRKRTKDIKTDNMETVLTYSLNLSYKASTITSPGTTQKSKDIPVPSMLFHGDVTTARGRPIQITKGASIAAKSHCLFSARGTPR